MARASVRTLLSLDEFAKLIGINPLHFNQVYHPELSPGNTCDVPIMQYGWQDAGRIGREEIAEAIALAELNLTEQLRYSPLPTWFVNDQVAPTRPYNPVVYPTGFGLRDEITMAQTSKGYVIMGGVETKIYVGTYPVVYYDEDSDGYKETATVTITGIDPAIVKQELAVYYPGENAEDGWEIRPIRDIQLGTDAIITLYRHQLVRPTLLEMLQPSGVDGGNDANFLTSVDVYRHFTDPSQQVQLVWDSPGFCEYTCYACQHSYSDGCMRIRDGRLGIIQAMPGRYDAASGNFFNDYCTACHAPDRLFLSYKAGYQGDMWKRIIARYATYYLQRPLCNCQPVEAAIKYWSDDLAYMHSSSVESISYRVPELMLHNPLGTSRGAMYAWQIVVKNKIGEAAVYA